MSRDTQRAISQENAEIVRQTVEATNRRDADAFVALVSPDVEWEDAVFWTEGPRTFRGRAGVREWLNQVLEPWQSLHLESEGVTDVSGGRFVARFDFTARGRESGVETQLRFWALCWVADGRITRREVFRERAEALEAAGLSE
jgi:ketosteroid isomerase-like protein